MSEKTERCYFRILVVVIFVGVTELIVGSYYHLVLGQASIGGTLLGIAVLGALFPGLAFMIGGSIYKQIRASRE